jgi:hypothetical protein
LAMSNCLPLISMNSAWEGWVNPPPIVARMAVKDPAKTLLAFTIFSECELRDHLKAEPRHVPDRWAVVHVSRVVGCADHREAHRSRSMGFASSAHPTALTQRELTCIPLDDVVRNMNRSLRGWVNYFHYRNSSDKMSAVRHHAEERLRTHLRKRHKVGNRKAGLVKFPRRDLYERYGLYKPPTEAGWRSAHASV